MPYKLSATLTGHTGDVRAVASPTNELVLSASRDTTAIQWQRPSSNEPFAPASVFKAGSRYVNSVAYVPPSPDAPKGYLVAGGLDTTINVFNLASPRDDPDFSLLGHSDNVCTLATSAAGTIVSGSWDSTAKVWKNFQLAYDLRGHQLSVMAVLIADEDSFITGSSDKTIKLWTEHKVIATLTGHTDAVRGLTLIPDIGFASCSNDSEVRVWTLGGDLVYTLSGHTSFVYSLSVLPTGDIISGGEDRSVRVWKDGECAEVIVLPALSVWAVSVMPNGDIVTGSSDHLIRIFSASQDRWAVAADLKEYEDKVASQTLPEQVGDVKKSDLPGPEALNEPGRRQGDVKMVKNGDVVEAHQWDSIAGTWQKIGVVTDAVGSGRTQTYQGKEYDYVFDVDIQDGVPPLKLPYNASENPYAAAQRFLENNDLPLSYLDQVVQFIEKNTGGVSLGTGGEEFVDPFTGASRYRSSAQPATSQGPASSYSDPFTGASRYSGGAPPPRQQAADTYMDPFTGASRYSGAPLPAPPAVTPSPSTTSNVLPAPKFILFKQVKDVTAIQNKIYELDNALRHEISTSNLALFPEDVDSVEETFSYLAALTSTPPEQPPLSLSPPHIDTIIQTLERWPVSQRFPVVDLGRLVAGYSPEIFESTPGLRSRFFSALFKASEWDHPWDLPLQKPRETNVLLMLKALANAFQDGHTPDPAWLKEILTLLAQAPYGSLGKTQRAAFATVLFNISCLSLQGLLDPTVQEQHLILILQVLKAEKSEPEPAYRALVGLGNVVYALKSRGATLSPAQAGEVNQTIQPLPSTFKGDSRVRNVIREINSYL